MDDLISSILKSYFYPMLFGLSKESYLLSTGRMLERASYYGIRALIVIYAIEKLGLSRESALSYYSFMTTLTYVFMLIAGLIGDLFKANKWVLLVAGTLEVTSVFFLMSEDIDTVFIILE